MKFENIKVGDTVYVFDAVKITFTRSEFFALPKEVIKVSGNKFVTEGNICYGKGGRQIGRYGAAYNLGDVVNSITIRDQTEEYNRFMKINNVEKQITNLLFDLTNLPRIADTGFSFEELSEIKNSLEAIYLKLKRNGK